MIRVHPETGRDLNKLEIIDLENRLRTQRILEKRKKLKKRGQRKMGLADEVRLADEDRLDDKDRGARAA